MLTYMEFHVEVTSGHIDEFFFISLQNIF